MTDDPFLKLSRAVRSSQVPSLTTGHEGRAHSPFSASGAERWLACPGSVALSEGVPDKSSIWALEGTEAHEVLEKMLLILIAGTRVLPTFNKPPEMVRHAFSAASFIHGLHLKTPGSEILVETRADLSFIHPKMFGTFDGAVIEHFGTLNVFDFKYGAGVPVGPVENLQMIFYGLSLAYTHHWNFKKIRLWIIQPRVRSYDGPLYWDLSVDQIKTYVDVFKRGAERAEKFPTKYVEGSWCHWCKAKSICPLKQEVKLEKAKSVFALAPLPR